MPPKIKKTDPENALVLGIDPSLNGAGFVLMQNMKVIDYWFFTTVRKIAEKFPDNAVYNSTSGLERLDRIYQFYTNLLSKSNPEYIGIEDYAYGAKSNSIFQIGGLGEMLRLITWQNTIPYRDYEPSKVKKFATKNGNAEKSQMVLEAFKNGFDVGPFGKSGEDLADAFWIARLISTELIIHKNNNHSNSLPKHQKEVFMESTKAYPTPIIKRPFIQKRGV